MNSEAKSTQGVHSRYDNHGNFSTNVGKKPKLGNDSITSNNGIRKCWNKYKKLRREKSKLQFRCESPFGRWLKYENVSEKLLQYMELKVKEEYTSSQQLDSWAHRQKRSSPGHIGCVEKQGRIVWL